MKEVSRKGTLASEALSNDPIEAKATHSIVDLLDLSNGLDSLWVNPVNLCGKTYLRSFTKHWLY